MTHNSPPNWGARGCTGRLDQEQAYLALWERDAEPAEQELNATAEQETGQQCRVPRLQQPQANHGAGSSSSGCGGPPLRIGEWGGQEETEPSRRGA